VKIITDMPLPTPRSVISSGTGCHGQDHGQDREDALVVDQVERAALEQLAVDGQGHEGCRVEDGQHKGEVPGVLRDLRGTRCAFLLKRLQPRDDHGEQLQDDAGGDVRHDPQREDRQLQQRTAGEQLDHLVEAGGVT
jgi:hypothetical protein